MITKEFAVRACRMQEEQYLNVAFEAGATGRIELMEMLLEWAKERGKAAVYFGGDKGHYPESADDRNL